MRSTRARLPVSALALAQAMVMAIGLAGMLPNAEAEEFSCATARLIVPWKPGGGTDVVMRTYAEAINAHGTTPYLQVVNISGARGDKGTAEAAKAKPDGCTLLAIYQSAIAGYLYGRIEFNWDTFETVSLLTDSPEIVGAAADAPWDSLTQMLEAARENPDTIRTAITPGSVDHFMWLLIQDRTGAKFEFVPFDGTRGRMTALLEGDVQLGALNTVAGKKYLAGGALKAYGIAAEKRSDQLPDLPTLKEQGLDLVYSIRRGVVVPKGTPKEKIDHWAALFEKASTDPELLKKMQARGTDIRWVGPEPYADWFAKAFAAHEEVAVKSGMYKKKE